MIIDKGFYLEIYINPDGVYSNSSEGSSYFRYIDKELTYRELLDIFDEGLIRDEILTIHIIPAEDSSYRQEREWSHPISQDLKENKEK